MSVDESAECRVAAVLRRCDSQLDRELALVATPGRQFQDLIQYLAPARLHKALHSFAM
jgi:hypothetical protein